MPSWQPSIEDYFESAIQTANAKHNAVLRELGYPPSSSVLCFELRAAQLIIRWLIFYCHDEERSLQNSLATGTGVKWGGLNPWG